MAKSKMICVSLYVQCAVILGSEMSFYPFFKSLGEIFTQGISHDALIFFIH